jgi:hypothetical protein
MGYSNDTKDIATKTCFMGTAVNDRKVQSTHQLDGGVCYDEFRTEFGFGPGPTGWGSFSQRPEANYMRFHEDKLLTKSYNYYSHIGDTVTVSINGTG